LVRSLEEEKIARNTIQSALTKLKDDYARTDLEKDKLIMDLSVKLDKAKLEKQQSELELTKCKEAQIKLESFY